MLEPAHYTGHLVPLGLVFSFEPSNGNYDLRSISTYDMQNYYNDIKYILIILYLQRVILQRTLLLI
jgi:hypothetical protein